MSGKFPGDAYVSARHSFPSVECEKFFIVAVVTMVLELPDVQVVSIKDSLWGSLTPSVVIPNCTRSLLVLNLSLHKIVNDKGCQ